MRSLVFLIVLGVAVGPAPTDKALTPDQSTRAILTTTSRVITIPIIRGQLGSIYEKFDAIITQYFAEHFADAGREYLSGIDGDAVTSFRDVHKRVAEDVGKKISTLIALVGTGDSVMYWNGSPRPQSDTTGGQIFYEFHRMIGIIELMGLAKSSNNLGNSGEFVSRILEFSDTAEWTRKITEMVKNWKGVGGQIFSSADSIEWQKLSIKIIARAHWQSVEKANDNRDILFSILSDDKLLRIQKFCTKQYLFNPESCDSLKSVLRVLLDDMNRLTIEALAVTNTVPDFSTILEDANTRIDYMFKLDGPLQNDLAIFTGLMVQLGYREAMNKGIKHVEADTKCPNSKLPIILMSGLRETFRLGATLSGFEKIKRDYPIELPRSDTDKFCSDSYPSATTEGILSGIKRAVLCFNAQSDTTKSDFADKCLALNTYFETHLRTLIGRPL